MITNSDRYFFIHIASVVKNKSDATANEEILIALSKRGPDALDVLIESLEVEEDVHKRIIERIRKGKQYLKLWACQ